MTEFVDRHVEYYDLPFSNGVKLTHPERAVLVYKTSHSTDIGALCYLRRSNEKRKRGQGCKVDISSFNEQRSREIRALINHLSEKFVYSGLKPISLHRLTNSFIQFMNWCDSQRHGDVLRNETFARAAFRGYIEYLRRKVNQNQLGTNTATCYQEHVLSVLHDYLNVTNLDQGVNRLRRCECLTKHTLVPDDTAQEKVLAWCKCLLNGLSELVVEQKPYPFRLVVPGYLNWQEDRLWVFPGKIWCSPPGHKIKRQFRAYDFLNGRVRALEEIEDLYGKTAHPSHTALLIERAQKVLANANQDFFCSARIERGLLACRAFLIMFIASTGKNPTQAVETPWNEELEASVLNPFVERQGFRTIKYRANNRLVYFEIGVEYMPYLRRYLQLRTYLLNGRQSAYLFFGYGNNISKLTVGPAPLPATTCETTLISLTRLTPTLSRIVPRQWRAAKQDHVIRNYDIATAARAMQHSEATALKKYSNGSEVTQQIELGNYLSQVENIVLNRSREIAKNEIRSMGVCTDPNHPKTLAEYLPLTPDCKGAEGCLFCDKYRVHADEMDARKLLSARYCIRKTASMASSHEQFDRFFDGVLKRIDFILNELKRHDVKIVDKIEYEVDVEGELDPYWSAKLEMLMELNLV